MEERWLSINDIGKYPGPAVAAGGVTGGHRG